MQILPYIVFPSRINCLRKLLIVVVLSHVPYVHAIHYFKLDIVRNAPLILHRTISFTSVRCHVPPCRLFGVLRSSRILERTIGNDSVWVKCFNGGYDCQVA